MKKTTFIHIIALALVLVMALPVSAVAHDSDDTTRVLTRADLVELADIATITPSDVPEGCIALSEDEAADFWESVCSDEESNIDCSPVTTGTDVSTYALRNLAYPVQNTAYPLAVNLENGQVIYNPNIGRTVTFSTFSQYKDLELSPTATAQVEDELLNYLSSQTGSYALVGWYVTVKFYFEAQNPISMKLGFTETCLFDTDEISLSVPYQQSNYTCSRAFGYPSNKDPGTDCYSVGFDGLFTFKNSLNGKILSLPFGGGVMANKQS